MTNDNYEGIYGVAFAKRWADLQELNPHQVRDCYNITSFNNEFEISRIQNTIFYKNTKVSPSIMWSFYRLSLKRVTKWVTPFLFTIGFFGE